MSVVSLERTILNPQQPVERQPVVVDDGLMLYALNEAVVSGTAAATGGNIGVASSRLILRISEVPEGATYKLSDEDVLVAAQAILSLAKTDPLGIERTDAAHQARQKAAIEAVDLQLPLPTIIPGIGSVAGKAVKVSSALRSHMDALQGEFGENRVRDALQHLHMRATAEDMLRIGKPVAGVTNGAFTAEVQELIDRVQQLEQVSAGFVVAASGHVALHDRVDSKRSQPLVYADTEEVAVRLRTGEDDERIIHTHNVLYLLRKHIRNMHYGAHMNSYVHAAVSRAELRYRTLRSGNLDAITSLDSQAEELPRYNAVHAKTIRHVLAQVINEGTSWSGLKRTQSRDARIAKGLMQQFPRQSENIAPHATARHSSKLPHVTKNWLTARTQQRSSGRHSR